MITSLVLVLALIISITFTPQPNDIVISTLDGAAAVLGESKED